MKLVRPNSQSNNMSPGSTIQFPSPKVSKDGVEWEQLRLLRAYDPDKTKKMRMRGRKASIVSEGILEQ